MSWCDCDSCEESRRARRELSRPPMLLTPEVRAVVKAAVVWLYEPTTLSRLEHNLANAVDALLKADPRWSKVK